MPTASIITDVVMRTGDAMARSWGLKDFKVLAVPLPIANLTDEQLDQRARDITPQVVKLLLEGQTA